MDFRFLIPVLVSYFTSVVGGGVALSLTHGFTTTMVLWLLVIKVVADLLSILFCRHFFKDQKWNIQFGWPKKNRITVCVVLCVMIGMSMNLFSQWVGFLFPNLAAVTSSKEYYAILTTLTNKWYYIVCGGILAPILEEIFFRGYIVEQCAQRNGMRMAIISGAVIFAFFHMDLYRALYAFIVGLLLNYIYIETRSLWLTILIHMANNLRGYILPPELYDYLGISVDERNFYWFAVIAVSGGIAVAGSMILIRYCNRCQEKAG